MATYTDDLDRRFKRSLARRTERGDEPLTRHELWRYRLHGCEYKKCDRGQSPPLVAAFHGSRSRPVRRDRPMPRRVDCYLAVMLYPLMHEPVALLRRYCPEINRDKSFGRALRTLENLSGQQIVKSVWLRQAIERGDSPDAIARAAIAGGGEAHYPDGRTAPISAVLLTPDARSELAALAQKLLDDYNKELLKQTADVSLIAKRQVKKLRGEVVVSTGSDAMRDSAARRRTGWARRRRHERSKRIKS